MKKALQILLIVIAVACGLFLFIHRRVIAAYLKGEPLPEAPEWHKTCGHSA